MKRFRTQPSVYVPRDHFYLLLNPRDSESIETLREVLEKCLEKIDTGDFEKFEWDSIQGTIYPELEDDGT
jgi:hypothetical protein